ncbi:hypothetical protein CEXT_770341 [Caerostris extrusa]|uniref:Uncharacterized protein n=1 Tax=Caerostris extrusa TaxID=172846 RepID=A0AAV4RCI3_CAEEX|nr:hypothetical protein CEXT_770341 [Caerostris extrusa]
MRSNDCWHIGYFDPFKGPHHNLYQTPEGVYFLESNEALSAPKIPFIRQIYCAPSRQYFSLNDMVTTNRESNPGERDPYREHYYRNTGMMTKEENNTAETFEIFSETRMQLKIFIIFSF